MASSCINCCIFHIISIPFNCRSDIAWRVTKAMIGPKVKIFVFRLVCFVSRIWRQNSSSGYLAFSHLGNRGLKFLIWTQGEINPGNRAHAKRPLIPYTFYLSFYLGKVWKPYIQESQLKSMIRCRVQTCSKEVLLRAIIWENRESHDTRQKIEFFFILPKHPF